MNRRDRARRVPLAALLLTTMACSATPPQSAEPTDAPRHQAPSETPAAPEPAPPVAVLFRNVTVFDGKSGRLAGPMDVLVEGNRIARMSSEAIVAPAGGTVLDGAGRTLMPGLIDSHVHLVFSASSQADLMDPKVGIELAQSRAAAEAKAMLHRGFTAVRDLGGPMLGALRDIDQGRLPGPRIYASGGMVSQTSGHGDFRLPHERSRRFGGETSYGEMLGAGFIADGRDEVLTAVRENLRAGATQIKVMAGGGAATVYDPLDTAQYTLDEMKAAVEAAEDWNTYVTVHAYTARSVRRAVEAGVKCIEHGQLLDEPTLKLLASEGVWLSLQALDPAPATAPANIREKKAQVIAGTDNAFKWARKYSVKLAWGTDFLFDPSNNKNQNKDILKLTQWMTPAEALKLVTYDNAQLLALSGPRNPYPGKLGVIEEGALADLLLVDGDPTANLELMADPEKNLLVIVKDGRIYKNTAK